MQCMCVFFLFSFLLKYSSWELKLELTIPTHPSNHCGLNNIRLSGVCTIFLRICVDEITNKNAKKASIQYAYFKQWQKHHQFIHSFHGYSIAEIGLCYLQRIPYAHWLWHLQMMRISPNIFEQQKQQVNKNEPSFKVISSITHRW